MTSQLLLLGIRIGLTAVAMVPLLAIAPTVAAQQADVAADVAARLDRLIQELDNDEFEVRERAERELIEAGEAALPKLRAASRDSATERRQRAARAAKQIRIKNTGLTFVSRIERPELVNTNSVAISPDGKFLYVSAMRAPAVGVFKHDPTTGTLAHIQSLTDATNLVGALAVRLSEDGKLAVAACGGGRSITLLERDAREGTLKLLSTFRNDSVSGLTLSAQSDAAFSPDGKFVYSLDRGGAVIALEITPRRELKHVETFAGDRRCLAGACGIAMHPQGTELLIAAGEANSLSVVKRDPATGKLSLHQVLRDEENGIHGFARVYAVCYSPDGRFAYTCSGRDHSVTALRFTADRKLEAIQEFINDQSDLQDFIRGNEIIITPDGLNLYASGSESHSLACFEVEPASGMLAFRATIRNEGTAAASGDGATGLTSSPDGRFVYVTVSSSNALTVFHRTARNP